MHTDPPSTGASSPSCETRFGILVLAAEDMSVADAVTRIGMRGAVDVSP
jgi:hypothetical protein